MRIHFTTRVHPRHVFTLFRCFWTVNSISTVTANCLPELRIRASRFELMRRVMRHFLFCSDIKLAAEYLKLKEFFAPVYPGPNEFYLNAWLPAAREKMSSRPGEKNHAVLGVTPLFTVYNAEAPGFVSEIISTLRLSGGLFRDKPVQIHIQCRRHSWHYSLFASWRLRYPQCNPYQPQIWRYDACSL